VIKTCIISLLHVGALFALLAKRFVVRNPHGPEQGQQTRPKGRAQGHEEGLAAHQFGDQILGHFAPQRGGQLAENFGLVDRRLEAVIMPKMPTDPTAHFVGEGFDDDERRDGVELLGFLARVHIHRAHHLIKNRDRAVAMKLPKSTRFLYTLKF